METESIVGMSFPRRRESSLSMVVWTPACAGVETEMLLHFTVGNEFKLTDRLDRGF